MKNERMRIVIYTSANKSPSAAQISKSKNGQNQYVKYRIEYACINIESNMYIHTHINTHICVHIHACMHIHTCMHTHYFNNMCTSQTSTHYV